MEQKRLSGNDRQVIIAIDALRQIFQKENDKFEQLVRRVPDGYRKYKQIAGVLDKLETAILDTVPLDQLKLIDRQMKASRFTMSTINPACMKSPEDDMWAMSIDDLCVLVSGCITCNCMICDLNIPDGEPHNKCELKRIMRELPVQFEGDEITMHIPCIKDKKEIEQ